MTPPFPHQRSLMRSPAPTRAGATAAMVLALLLALLALALAADGMLLAVFATAAETHGAP